jgi:hypothetical protein
MIFIKFDSIFRETAGVSIMNVIKLFIALITIVSFSVAQQPDTTSQKQVVNNSTPQKVVVAVESSKTLNKALLANKKKTTWTKIKDLFM